MQLLGNAEGVVTLGPPALEGTDIALYAAEAEDNIAGTPTPLLKAHLERRGLGSFYEAFCEEGYAECSFMSVERAN